MLKITAELSVPEQTFQYRSHILILYLIRQILYNHAKFYSLFINIHDTKICKPKFKRNVPWFVKCSNCLQPQSSAATILVYRKVLLTYHPI
jgi:hypothetical protein